MRMDIFFRIKNKLYIASKLSSITAHTKGYGVEFNKLNSPYVSHREVSYIYSSPRNYVEGDIFIPDVKMLIGGGIQMYRNIPIVLKDNAADDKVWQVKMPVRFVKHYIGWIIEHLGLSEFYKDEDSLIPVAIPTKEFEKKYSNYKVIFRLHDESLPVAYKLAVIDPPEILEFNNNNKQED